MTSEEASVGTGGDFRGAGTITEAVEMERGQGKAVTQGDRGEKGSQNNLVIGQMWRCPTERQNLGFLA